MKGRHLLYNYRSANSFFKALSSSASVSNNTVGA